MGNANSSSTSPLETPLPPSASAAHDNPTSTSACLVSFPKRDILFNEMGKPANDNGKEIKPCCVCPETKKARDNCVLERGEENCNEFIATHKACLRSYGFKV